MPCLILISTLDGSILESFLLTLYLGEWADFRQVQLPCPDDVKASFLRFVYLTKRLKGYCA